MLMGYFVRSTARLEVDGGEGGILGKFLHIITDDVHQVLRWVV